MGDNSKYNDSNRRITTRRLKKFKKEGRKITILTAYDFPTAKILDSAGIDCVLVGDSAGTVVAGHKNTLPVTMDEMIYLTKAVSRGIDRALLVGDMPFMSFQISESETIRNAGRFLKEGGASAVKLEGGSEIAPLILKMVDFGIPVMGHIGLTPQSINKFGGHLIFGKTERQKNYLMQSARALQDAGCFSIVLESVKPEVAKEITESVSIPTIGIGAGVHCDAQVLVLHDLLGLSDWTPSFAKQFANLGAAASQAARQFADEVAHRKFPGDAHSFR